jgi:hypothetical protein
LIAIVLGATAIPLSKTSLGLGLWIFITIVWFISLLTYEAKSGD